MLGKTTQRPGSRPKGSERRRRVIFFGVDGFETSPYTFSL